jgi:hypothetical protein
VRYLQMRKVIAEIAEKKAQDLPLIPKLRPKSDEPEAVQAHGRLN